MQSFRTLFKAAAAASLILSSSVFAKSDNAPPTVDVNVVNDESSPVPVTTTVPEFYRASGTVFGLGDDRTEVVPVTESLILYDIFVRTSTIKDAAGCLVEISLEEGGEGGPMKQIFRAVHSEMDTTVWRDGQKTQQRLGRGVVVLAGDNIVIFGGHVTDPDIDSSPSTFCSSEVQIFGEIIQN